jgi:hypothetical protein
MSRVPPVIARVIAEILEYIKRGGGAASDWYVGIAAGARDRLFNDHKVSEQQGSWIYRGCDSTDAARAVEEHFLNLGCRGGPGGGDDDTTFVYAYRITSYTVE